MPYHKESCNLPQDTKTSTEIFTPWGLGWVGKESLSPVGSTERLMFTFLFCNFVVLSFYPLLGYFAGQAVNKKNVFLRRESRLIRRRKSASTPVMNHDREFKCCPHAPRARMRVIRPCTTHAFGGSGE